MEKTFVVDAGVDQTICLGSSAILTANFGNNYVIDVTANGASDYSLSGAFSGNDPPINIKLGDTLTFNVNASGHPFYLKTSNTTGTSDAISVTNNGTFSGSITWSPTIAGTYYYICEYHAGMVGTITVTNSTATYAWSTGETTQAINEFASVSATYSVTVTDGNCTATDNVAITVTPLPTVDLGNDVSICAGDSTLLDAGSGHTNYLWNTGETTQTIYVDNTGTYNVTVGNGTATNSGNSLSFDGVDDYVETSFVGGDIRNKFSFSITFKTNDPNGGSMFGKYGNLCGLGYAMVVLELHDSIPRLLMRQNNGASSVGVALPSIPLSDNQWHTVNFTYDNTGTSPICYSVIDGNPGTYITQDVWGNSPIQTLTGGLNQLPWFIGTSNTCNPNTEYFNGSISNLAIYDDVVYDFNVAQNPMFSYSFSSGSGNALIDGSQNLHHGTINGATWSTDAPTQYTNNCTATDDIIVTVNSLDDATFAFSTSSYCADDSDPTPTISGTAGGTFSSSTGLVMTNGVIDLDASIAGTYTITYTTPGVCSASSTQDVTITTPSTDFSYDGATEFCLGTNNPVATISGAAGGTFSATGGLIIDANTGEIDLSTATAGNYQVTYTPPISASSGWQQVGQDIDGETAGDYSGYPVSLSSDGSIVAIGATDNDGNGTNAGHVRIYENNGGTWQQIGQDIDGETAYDRSGISVSLSSDGSIVAIGAVGNDGNGSYAGHVRIYENNGGSWQQAGQDIDGEAAGDYSGYSVSLSSDGSIVAIGATDNYGNGSAAGHVRIYENNGGTWQQIGQDIDGEATGDFSGISVSLSSDGSIVAIGADGNDGTGVDAGHVRIYENNGGTWQQVGQDIDGEAADDYSGYPVSLSSDGSIVAIGAESDGNGINAGHVRIYENNGGTWQQIGQDIDGEAAGDYSGYSVSLSSDGSIVATGAEGNDGTGMDAGHVRVFSNSSVTSSTTSCPLPLDITIHAAPTIDLGPDTTLICDGTSETLDAGTGFASYLWSDGSTNQTLTATTAGTYTV